MKNKLLTLFIAGMIVCFCFSGISFGCPAPKVESLSVNHGINKETVGLTITGSGFHKSTYVKLIKPGEPDIVAQDVKVVSSSQVTCSLDLSDKTAGQWDVVVGNIGTITKKEKPFLIANGFTIEYPGLNVTEIQPNKAVNNGAINLTIHGTGFRLGAKVVLSGGQMDIGASNVKVSSDTQLTCTLDLNGVNAGVYNLKVVNDDGKTGVLANRFTVIEPVAATSEKKPAPKINTNQLLKPVFFDYDKSDLRYDQLETLDSDIAVLKNNPQLFILLGGHADERGTREYNLELSRRRAETVKQYLVEHGVSPEWIVIYAYGKEYPAKEGHNESAWSYNRRVDIIVYEKKPDKMSGIRNLEKK